MNNRCTTRRNGLPRFFKSGPHFVTVHIWLVFDSHQCSFIQIFLAVLLSSLCLCETRRDELDYYRGGGWRRSAGMLKLIISGRSWEQRSVGEYLEIFHRWSVKRLQRLPLLALILILQHVSGPKLSVKVLLWSALVLLKLSLQAYCNMITALVYLLF